MLKPGAIVAVPLTDSKVAFARLLTFPFIEFYDVVVSPADISSFDLVTLSERQPTFTVLVHKSGATGRRWKRVGEDPTGASEVPGVFWQDLVDPTKIEIHRGDETVESATYEEVLEVEREAVWDPEHCEQRLRDHIAGTPNANREQLRPKRP